MELIVALVDLNPWTAEPRLEAEEDLCPVPLLDEDHITCVGTTIVAAEAEMIHQTLKNERRFFFPGKHLICRE